MIKFEAKFTTYFEHWLKSIYLPKHRFFAGAFEIKHTHNKPYINFNEVQDHQIRSLLAVNNEGLIYKISDSGLGFKPFDCFTLKNQPAFLVIKYKTFFVLIDINTFILEKKSSQRKSLTEIRAKAIAHLIVHTNLNLHNKKEVI